MTDPLTGKELVQKSYEYVDKLTKECAKVLLEDFNKTHKKFQVGNLADETAASTVQWFDKRDKNVRISYDRNSVMRVQPTQMRMRFKGTTKDADFSLDATVGAFVIPGTEVNDQTTCFVKTLVINADKNNFTKRK
ncbi:MAG: hypothetical protein JRN20_10275 [Nitrososphaerota archaeon]|nr:hypothetical protein [Nitrososphaerota archaeon]MDG6922581.1 hypothetical protein [Nitrososphaerota archaeon]